MGRKLCGKIILEGTRLTHKTEVAFRLNEHPRFVGPRKYRYHSPLISGEWCAFTNFPWGRGLINFNEKEEAKALETYELWVSLFENLRYYTWIIDRFHLSTIVAQKELRGVDMNMRWLEERLANLGFHLALLTRSPESFEAARKIRLKVSGNPSQYDDLEPFIDEQERFKAVAEKSILPVKIFDISHNNINRAADEIVDWMDETGGLYAREV